MDVLRRAPALDVLWIFLRLGLTCFGGPVAHIGYFRREFVLRRGWLDDAAYADLVALCQFLPGPSSSQVGFSIGLMRAGYLGGVAAWAGFTLPSAAAMLAFAYGADAMRGAVAAGLLHGLKLVAVAIVAQAVWGMARMLCPDAPRLGIAAVAAGLSFIFAGPLSQVGVILLAGAAGIILCRSVLGTVAPGHLTVPISRRAAAAMLGVFAALLAGLEAWHGSGPAIAEFAAFYHSGALVFGGGHVALPLLQSVFVSTCWISNDKFLAGYGAAQAVPGPLFTFAAYLGAVVRVGPGGVAGAAMGLVGLFLPGMLLLMGVLPYWDRLRRIAAAQAVMRGVNASVVGLLAAALYNPVFVNSVHSAWDFAIVLVALGLLVVARVPPLAAVCFCAVAGLVLAR